MVRALWTVCLAAVGLGVVAGPALAHEEREVGQWVFVVGFGSEPAYAGFENSVQLLLSDSNGPVTDLGDTLKVDVQFGDQTMAMDIEPFFEEGEFGTPGDYRAFFIPTRPGVYTFHFTGTIEGTSIDESFMSSPTTFTEVQDPATAQFPAKDPTTAQVSERLDREIPRLQSQIQTAQSAAEDKADGARTLALVSLIVGGLGLVLGAVGLARGRKTS